MKILYELVSWSILTNSSGQISDAYGKTWGAKQAKSKREHKSGSSRGSFYEFNNIEKQDHM